MPWMETCPMDERLRFIQDAHSDRWTMVALCERYGISCRIGYKWLARYAEEGRRGLVGSQSAPASQPIQDAPCA